MRAAQRQNNLMLHSALHLAAATTFALYFAVLCRATRALPATPVLVLCALTSLSLCTMSHSLCLYCSVLRLAQAALALRLVACASIALHAKIYKIHNDCAPTKSAS